MFSFAQRYVKPMLLVVLSLSVSPLAAPASFTFSGAFNRDDQVQLFNITTTAPALVELRSFGYGGGVASPGGTISAGGLDTVLTLFSSTGSFLAENDDGTDVSLDPSTGAAYDARLTINLLAGNHIVALTQYDNFATGATLAAGFDRTGMPNFTAGSDFSSGGTVSGRTVQRPIRNWRSVPDRRLDAQLWQCCASDCRSRCGSAGTGVLAAFSWGIGNSFDAACPLPLFVLN